MKEKKGVFLRRIFYLCGDKQGDSIAACIYGERKVRATKSAVFSN